jgi:DNA polymerase-3 subunit epsilon
MTFTRYLTDPAFTAATWICIDFEGVTPPGFPAEPIEVGAIWLRPHADGLRCLGRFEALIRPPEHAPLTGDSTRLTGITAAMLAGQPRAAIALARLHAALPGPPYVSVAHHAPTEAGILRRYAHACPALAATSMIDTVRLGRALWPGLASYALDALLTHAGIPIPAGRHRALADAEVTARLLERLLADGAQLHRWSRLAQLHDLAGHPPPAPPVTQTALF